VSVPARLLVAVLAEKENPTVPLPDPEDPDVSVIHEVLLTAPHAHPAAAVTVLLPEPAAALADWLAGEIEGAHAGENENELDRIGVLVPPGPAALTRVS
jgi:hypothetical protein